MAYAPPFLARWQCAGQCSGTGATNDQSEAIHSTRNGIQRYTGDCDSIVKRLDAAATGSLQASIQKNRSRSPRSACADQESCGSWSYCGRHSGRESRILRRPARRYRDRVPQAERRTASLGRPFLSEHSWQARRSPVQSPSPDSSYKGWWCSSSGEYLSRSHGRPAKRECGL
jgi:hypothetical protein